MRASTRLLAPLVALTVLLGAACGTGGVVDPAAATSSQAATPPDNQLNLNATVNIRMHLEPTSLNPFSTAGAELDQLLLDNVYQGLISVDTNDRNAIVPALASSYQESADGLRYTFHLVDTARFHDGRPVTSADVVWSLDQQTTPGSTGIDAVDFTSIAAVTAPDPHTVTITLRHRDTSLLWNLTQRGGIIYQQDTNFSTLDGAENGTGPFRITAWDHGASITLARDNAYWGAKPKVAKVIVHYIADTNTANNAEQTGQTDIETEADPTLLQPFTGSSGFTVLTGSSTDKYTLAFNDAQAPFTNPAVRHAIRQAINNADVIKAVGGGIAIGSDVPPQDPWYANLTGIDAYNPANARKLLAAAGYPHGLTLTLTVATIYSTTVSDVLVSELKQVGITLVVKQVEFQTWLSQVYTDHDFQLSFVDHVEARDLGNYANPKYYFGYDSPQVQQWYAAAQTAVSDTQRDQLMAEAARQISLDAAADWLYLGEDYSVVRHGIYGVPVTEFNDRYNLATLAVAK